MASTSESAPAEVVPGRLFYCHRCTHQWRKLEDSEFNCPQCQEGFIEDINDTTISAVQLAPAAVRMDALSQIISRLPSETRARSRSPRHVHNFGSFMRAASELSVISPSSSSSSGSTSGARFSEFQFDLDDLMSSFLQTPRPSPMTQARLDEIPVLAVTDEHISTQCSICFDEFLLSEPKVRQMPCKHIFHEECIFPWLRINGNCPVCRSRLIPGTEGEDTPPARDAARYDDILRFMRLRRSMSRRATGESSNSNLPPQSAVRGRVRGHTSSSRQPPLPELIQSSRGRPRMFASSVTEEAASEGGPEQLPREESFEELGRRFFRDLSEFPEDVDAAMDFTERRRRAVRHNVAAGSSGSQIPTLRTAAAAVRARALISGRRNSSRRNQSNPGNEEREVINIRARTDPSTFRTVFEILPGPGELTLEEAARERARRERDYRNQRRNRMLESIRFPPAEEGSASSAEHNSRPAAPAFPTIDLTTNEESPVSPIPHPAAVLSSDSSTSESSSSDSSSSSSSLSGPRLTSPLSEISEEETMNFLGTIGSPTSSNEE